MSDQLQRTLNSTYAEMNERLEDRMHCAFNEYCLPDYMWPGLKHWVFDGVEPGSFLFALLRNNLVDSFSKADDNNLRRMHQWVKMLYNHVPGECWGSEEKYIIWLEMGGLHGKQTR